MTKRVAFAGIITVLLIGALLFANHYRKRDPIYILSLYPQTPTLQLAIDSYTKSSAYQRTLVFSEASFDKTLNSTLDCGVAQDGARSCWAGSHLWGSGRGWKLTPQKTNAIQAITRNMPSTFNQPAPENLLIVGFWQKGKWTVQLYDKSRLPWQIKRIRANY